MALQNFTSVLLYSSSLVLLPLFFAIQRAVPRNSSGCNPFFFMNTQIITGINFALALAGKKILTAKLYVNCFYLRDLNMILLVLTSHRTDCFDICLKCLEQNTDLTVFEKIYIMANDLTPDHMQLAAAFARRHRNSVVVDFRPRGWEPLMKAQDVILSQHKRSVMVKIDEDVFVMPGWLQGLLKAYKNQTGTGCGLVSALVPNNQTGRHMLHNAFIEAFPDYAEMADDIHKIQLSQNADYALWLWKKFMAGKLDLSCNGLLKDLKPQKIDFYLNINCILVDPVFLECVLPFGESTDECNMNFGIKGTSYYGLVTPASIAHHYSFGPQQEVLDAHINVPDLEPLLLGFGKNPVNTNGKTNGQDIYLA